jgi:release factor glutamine methyltransferase
MQIYQPAEDSYLMSETLKKYLINFINNIKDIKILDMGSGSGIQAQTCKDLGFNNILTADINQEAVKLLKNKGFKSIKTNLFSKIKKEQKFNLIIFNPPYLPENKYDKKPDTTAGKKGYELIIKFLKQAKSHLNQEGKIILLISSFSKPNIIKKQAKKSGYKINLLNKKSLFFEKLFVLELTA